MIRQNLQAELTRNGFGSITSNLPGVCIFYKCNNNVVYAVNMIEVQKDHILTSEQCQNILRQIQELFKTRGYKQIETFTLVLAFDVAYARSMCNDNSAYWIIDLENIRLLIYEDQPRDFCGIGVIVQNAIDQEKEGCKGEKCLQSEGEESHTLPLRERFHLGYIKSGEFIKRRSVFTVLIIMVNVLVFLVLSMGGSTENSYYMVIHGAAYAPYIVQGGEYYRLVTSMFLHFGISHLLNNMIVLFVLGESLERAVGKVRYLIIYFLSGLAGSILSLFHVLASGDVTVSAGASGAIFGVMGALFYVVLINKGRIDDLTSTRLGLLAAVSLYHGFAETGIDNYAHLGGLFMGILVGIVLYDKKRTKLV